MKKHSEELSSNPPPVTASVDPRGVGVLGIPGLQPASPLPSESSTSVERSSASSVDLGRRRGAQDLRFLLEALRERMATHEMAESLPFAVLYPMACDEARRLLRDFDRLLARAESVLSGVAERSGASSRPRSGLLSEEATDGDVEWFDVIARALRASVKNGNVLRAKFEDSEAKRTNLEERLIASQEATAQALGALKFAQEQTLRGWHCAALHCLSVIDADTGQCSECGLDHSTPCEACGLRGIHADDCPEADTGTAGSSEGGEAVPS